MDEQNRTELGRWLAAERGRAAELARRCGVKEPVVSEWASGRSAVPVRHCPTVEEFSGIPCERLQPAVRWYVLRNGARPCGTTTDAAMAMARDLGVEGMTPDAAEAANDEPERGQAA